MPLVATSHPLIVIRRGDGLFYTGPGYGRGWSPELASARLFPTPEDAKRALAALPADLGAWIVHFDIDLPLPPDLKETTR